MTRQLACCCVVVAFLVARDTCVAPIPTLTYEVVRVYPHDAAAYTEGLFYRQGYLYESTGIEGHSGIRKVRLQTGETVLARALPPQFFGEGITYDGDRLIELTWRSHVGFVYNLRSFSLESRFTYRGEGWALTRNDRELIMSDGTSELRILEPATFRELRRIRVKARGEPLERLNELEWVDGVVLANVWETDRIACIDPATGDVVAWIDLSGLLSGQDRHPGQYLNGIAYDSADTRLFVTGKYWPRLFEIRLLSR